MFGRKVNLLLIASSLLLALADAASAQPTLNVTSYTGIADAGPINLNPGGAATVGVSTALYPSLASANSTFLAGSFNGAAPTNQTFTTAFNTWNTNQGGNFGGNWNIINGGNLNVTFNVADTASADADFGGISDFNITIAQNPGYTGPNLNQLVWTQGLYISYQVQPPYNTSVNPPFNTLDAYSFSQGNPSTAAFISAATLIPGQAPGANNHTPAVIGAPPANTAYADPIYPFQYNDQSFFDGPQSFWPDQSFRAIALLSTVTFVTNSAGAVIKRDLTVYNGIDWGFNLTLPEPSALMLLLPNLLLIALCHRPVSSPLRAPRTSNRPWQPKKLAACPPQSYVF